MGIQYLVTFYFLIFEICLYLLLVIPWPYKMRKALLHIFTTSSLAQSFYQLQAFLLVLVSLLFADSLRTMYLNQEKHENMEETEEKAHHHGVGEEIADQKLHTKIFFAQRNVYLTSFTLFVSFALYRLTALLKSFNNAEEKAQSLEVKLKNLENTQEKEMAKEDKKTI